MANDGGNNNNRVSSSSSSKRLLMMTDDDPSVSSSSSVHAVVFNDDLLIEILLRLPVISLFFFKSVSKRWLSLITSPAFFNLRLTRFPNIHPPSGLFLQKEDSTLTYIDHDFVSLDSRIPAGKKKKSSAFTFGCFGSDASDVRVWQSCNGLLLCIIRTNTGDKIYVYNPSINMSRMLPQAADGLKITIFFHNMRLAFDPTKSPHYKVLHIRVIDPCSDQRPPSIQTRIYSSETGCWRIGGYSFPLGWFRGDFSRGVYWNDALHWFDDTNRVRHFKLDVEHPPDTATQLPKTVDSNSYKELFESRGSLLLSCAGNSHPKQLEIHEMMNEYSGWSVKYIVKYAESSIEAFFERWKKSVGFGFIVLLIVVGEREEESFVVMELCGKVVKYNLLSKTLHMLRDIDTHYPSTFPFIASFASV